MSPDQAGRLVLTSADVLMNESIVQTSSPESNRFLSSLKVDRFSAYFDWRDFPKITRQDDPDLCLLDGDRFDEMETIVRKYAKGEDSGFQRIDIALIKIGLTFPLVFDHPLATVMFLQDQWPRSYKIFDVYEAHCSYRTFSNLFFSKKLNVRRVAKALGATRVINLKSK